MGSFHQPQHFLFYFAKTQGDSCTRQSSDPDNAFLGKSEWLVFGWRVDRTTRSRKESVGQWCHSGAFRLWTEDGHAVLFQLLAVQSFLVTESSGWFQHPKSKSLQRKSRALEHAIIDFQREIVRPIPVRFEVRKIGD